MIIAYCLHMMQPQLFICPHIAQNFCNTASYTVQLRKVISLPVLTVTDVSAGAGKGIRGNAQILFHQGAHLSHKI